METVPVEPIDKRPIKISPQALIAICVTFFSLAGAFFKIDSSQTQLKEAVIEIKHDMQEMKQEQKEANTKKATEVTVLKDQVRDIETRQLRMEIILKSKNLMEIEE